MKYNKPVTINHKYIVIINNPNGIPDNIIKLLINNVIGSVNYISILRYPFEKLNHLFNRYRLQDCFLPP